MKRNLGSSKAMEADTLQTYAAIWTFLSILVGGRQHYRLLEAFFQHFRVLHPAHFRQSNGALALIRRNDVVFDVMCLLALGFLLVSSDLSKLEIRKIQNNFNDSNLVQVILSYLLCTHVISVQELENLLSFNIFY